MKTLDQNVKIALEHGMVIAPVRERSKILIGGVYIETLEQWRAAQESHGPMINAAIHLWASNLCILDLDRIDGLTLLSEVMQIPQTMTTLTKRGLHLYFQRDSYMGQAGELYVDDQHLGQFICGNAEKHYAVMPGSIHPTNRPYLWLHDPTFGIARFPNLIYEFVVYDGQDRPSGYMDF